MSQQLLLKKYPSIKKKKKIEKLVPLMPVNRRTFWVEILTLVTAVDLLEDQHISDTFHMIKTILSYLINYDEIAHF